MNVESGLAPAKINLTLHVTGRRDDGYHLLDSLVVFAGVGDKLRVSWADDLSLTVDGPFKGGIPTDENNIIIKAAMALLHARKIKRGAAIQLTKTLPHPAGIGGGSSDAATVLRLLAELWQVEPLEPTHPFALALGADVPVCMSGPAPMRMAGIGDLLMPAPALPECALVLINTRAPVSTANVFSALHDPDNNTMPQIPSEMDFEEFIEWLKFQRNDLLVPARALTSGIDIALDKLNSLSLVKHAVMSGSGATCVGIVENITKAKQVARAIQVAEQSWWVTAAPVLRAPPSSG